MEEEIEMNEMQAPEDAGRGTDSVMAHLSLGEIVIPRAVQDDPEVQAMLQEIFARAGADINEFTVGHEANKINPETGYPEFFFKKLKKVFRAVAPLAVNFIPGVGPLAGAALGAGVGALSGGGLKGALAGGLSGYAGAGGGSILGKALGATGAASTALGSGLLGAGAGGITGGAKGALLGGALGGVGGYANAGGFDDLYQGSALQDVFKGASGALDRVSSGADSLYQGSALQDAFRSGNDALDAAGFNISGNSNVASSPIAAGGGSSSYSAIPYGTPTEGLSSAFGKESADLINNAGTGGLSSSLASNPSTFNTGAEAMASNKYLSPISSALLGTYSNDKAEKQLLKSQAANQALLDPYLNFQFNPEDLENDPGYQFNLAEGNKQLDRQQLARGGYFSGNALREGVQFGQGLADNTYNSAFQRALQTNQQGLTGAGVGMGINENIGNIKSGSTTNLNNLYTGALGSLFGGDSFSNTGALQGGNAIPEWLQQYLGRSSYAG